jgi:hypothetical protein
MLQGAVHQALEPNKEFHRWGNVPIGPTSQLPRTYGELSLWNPAWANLDAAKIQSIRGANVNSILMTPKRHGGGYELNPPK